MNLTRNLWMAAALSGIILLPGCSETPAEQAQDTTKALSDIAEDAARSDAHSKLEWEKGRNAILADLRSLRDGIDKDLGLCKQELAKKDLRSIERARQTTMQAELEREKKLVEDEIASIEGIGTDVPEADRSRLRLAAERTRDEVKTWWEKRKEEQDKHTDADYDNDGH